MADRRRRETRETDDNEYEDEPSRLVPRWVVQESFTADRTQNDRMIEVQLEALGTNRRDIMSTSDHPENMGEVDLDSIQRRRRINQSGTAESNVTPETVGKLSSWNNAHALLKDDGTADEGLQDLAAGQTHRVKLMNQSPRDYDTTRNQGDAGRRGSARNRSGAHGGRGGGVVGTHGRATRSSRTSRGPPVSNAPPLPRSPVVRLPNVAPDLHAVPSSTAIPPLAERREQLRRRNEVPAAVRELSAKHYESRLASPSDFMASLTTHGLLEPTSLLDGPAEDEPITEGAARMNATENAPLGTEVAAADALFKFIEGDAVPVSSTSAQTKSARHVGDLQGLEMTEALSETEKDTIGPPLVQSSSTIAPSKSEKKSKEPGMWETYMNMELHNLFPSIKKGTAQKHITEYFKAVPVKETGRDKGRSTSEAAVVNGTGRDDDPSTSEAAAVKETGRDDDSLASEAAAVQEGGRDDDSSTSEAAEGFPRITSQSTARQPQSRHDEFTRAVQDGFDPTNIIFTGTLSKSRWASRGPSASTLSLPIHLAGATIRTPVQTQVVNSPSPDVSHAVPQPPKRQNVASPGPAVHAEPSSIVASPTPDRGRGDGSSRASTLSTQYSNSSRLNDPGAAARQQCDGARAGVVAPTPSYQLSATALATGADRGRVSTRGPMLPAHLADTPGLSDPGAVAREKYGGARGARGGALALNPTRQLPATTSVTSAGRGRGIVAPPPSGAFNGTIRPGPGPSMWNRGRLFKDDDSDDDSEDEVPKRQLRSLNRHL